MAALPFCNFRKQKVCLQIFVKELYINEIPSRHYNASIWRRVWDRLAQKAASRPKSVEKMIKGSFDDTASYAKSDSRVAD